MSPASITVVGVDIFVHTTSLPTIAAGTDLGSFELKTISNRGTKVWPPPTPPIHMTDVYGCRFMYKGAGHPPVLELLTKLEKMGWNWVHIEKLNEINGKAGYSVAQGE